MIVASYSFDVPLSLILKKSTSTSLSYRIVIRVACFSHTKEKYYGVPSFLLISSSEVLILFPQFAQYRSRWKCRKRIKSFTFFINIISMTRPVVRHLCIN